MPDAASDTEQQILDAAHRVFVRRGVDGARTQEIAEEAGVNKALLHYYFRTKDRLAEAVFLRAAGQLFPNLAAALMAPEPLATRIRQVVAFELDFLRAHPFLPGYILAEMRTRPDALKALLRDALPIDTLRPALLGSLQQALDAGAADGSFRPMRAEDLLVSLVSLIVFPFAARPLLEVLLGLDADGFDAFIDRRKEALAEFVLAGLRP